MQPLFDLYVLIWGIGIVLNLVVVWRWRDVVEWQKPAAWILLGVFCLIPYLLFGFVALCWLGWRIGKHIASRHWRNDV